MWGGGRERGRERTRERKRERTSGLSQSVRLFFSTYFVSCNGPCGSENQNTYTTTTSIKSTVQPKKYFSSWFLRRTFLFHFKMRVNSGWVAAVRKRQQYLEKPGTEKIRRPDFFCAVRQRRWRAAASAQRVHTSFLRAGRLPSPLPL